MNPPVRKIPFDVYLPATADKAPVFAETIEVEVYENFGQDFLTPESSELIERTRARQRAAQSLARRGCSGRRR